MKKKVINSIKIHIKKYENKKSIKSGRIIINIGNKNMLKIIYKINDNINNYIWIILSK